MNYTNWVLFALGILGILLHNLVELNKINRSSGGNVKIMQYLKIERFSIYISIIMVFCCIMIKHEIVQLEQAGKWIGLAFIAIGYMGQSLLIFIMGKATKTVGMTDDKNTENGDNSK